MYDEDFQGWVIITDLRIPESGTLQLKIQEEETELHEEVSKRFEKLRGTFSSRFSSLLSSSIFSLTFLITEKIKNKKANNSSSA